VQISSQLLCYAVDLYPGQTRRGIKSMAWSFSVVSDAAGFEIPSANVIAQSCSQPDHVIGC
jgi:hypothetical protein